MKDCCFIKKILHFRASYIFQQHKNPKTCFYIFATGNKSIVCVQQRIICGSSSVCTLLTYVLTVIGLHAYCSPGLLWEPYQVYIIGQLKLTISWLKAGAKSKSIIPSDGKHIKGVYIQTCTELEKGSRLKGLCARRIKYFMWIKECEKKGGVVLWKLWAKNQKFSKVNLRKNRTLSVFAYYRYDLTIYKNEGFYFSLSGFCMYAIPFIEPHASIRSAMVSTGRARRSSSCGDSKEIYNSSYSSSNSMQQQSCGSSHQAQLANGRRGWPPSASLSRWAPTAPMTMATWKMTAAPVPASLWGVASPVTTALILGTSRTATATKAEPAVKNITRRRRYRWCNSDSCSAARGCKLSAITVWTYGPFTTTTAGRRAAEAAAERGIIVLMCAPAALADRSSPGGPSHYLTTSEQALRSADTW